MTLNCHVMPIPFQLPRNRAEVSPHIIPLQPHSEWASKFRDSVMGVLGEADVAHDSGLVKRTRTSRIQISSRDRSSPASRCERREALEDLLISHLVPRPGPLHGVGILEEDAAMALSTYIYGGSFGWTWSIKARKICFITFPTYDLTSASCHVLFCAPRRTQLSTAVWTQ